MTIVRTRSEDEYIQMMDDYVALGMRIVAVKPTFESDGLVPLPDDWQDFVITVAYPDGRDDKIPCGSRRVAEHACNLRGTLIQLPEGKTKLQGFGPQPFG